MPLPNKPTFRKPAPRPAAPPQRKSKYAGTQASTPRPPLLGSGDAIEANYRVRVLGAEEGENPGTGNQSYKLQIEIVASENEAHPEGSASTVVFMIGGRGAAAGKSRVKSCVMGVLGYALEQEDEYDQFDPDGECIDATTGVKNAYSDVPFIGRIVDVYVRRGKETSPGSGEHYHEYTWSPVVDAEQDS